MAQISDEEFRAIIAKAMDTGDPGELLAAVADDPDQRLGVQHILDMLQRPQPVIGEVPVTPRGFRLRVDLVNTAIWRRLEVPGSLTLDDFHFVLQYAMGWMNSHLHRFTQGADYQAPYFVNDFDVSEGERGVNTRDVRLDQVVFAAGEFLHYEYDFGDGWSHRIEFEAVLDELPEVPVCLDGALACPPEDCGGVSGYAEIVKWIRDGYPADSTPKGLQPYEMKLWLPDDWDPDQFSVEDTNRKLAAVVREPIPVTGELRDIAEIVERQGSRVLRNLLSAPAWQEAAELSDDEAAAALLPYQQLLEVIGDGVKLTSAGKLPPVLVSQFAQVSGISNWWIGRGNREDQTFPVAIARETARALGLVTVRNGRLTPTAAGRRTAGDPQAMWRHCVGRIPLGRDQFDRHAGWLMLVAAGSGAPVREWETITSDLLAALGWRYPDDPYATPPAASPTRHALMILSGSLTTGWVRLEDRPAVAVLARDAIRSAAGRHR